MLRIIRHLAFFGIVTLVTTFRLSAQSAFIINTGQWDKDILFKAEFTEGNLYVEENGFNYNLLSINDLNNLVEAHHQQTYAYEKHAEWTIQGHCVKVKFNGASFNTEQQECAKPIAYYHNYYLGKDKSKWRSKVPAYQRIRFNDCYPGIDIELNASNNAMKYDILLKPHADPSNIQIEYQGADNLFINDGHLHIQTSVNTLIEQAPYAYQFIEGEKQAISCRYVLQNETIRFEFPQGYNKSIPLVIDPFIVFSRYSSSSANNFGYTATYDSEGNAYGAGSVFNVGYITTPGAFDVTFNGASTDIGISKYTPDGLNRIYATYLGGGQTELPHSIVVNSNDELFVLGTTSSDDFPTTTGCFDSTFAGGTLSDLSQGLGVIYNFGSDLIVSRFSEDGSSLLASTYVGGSLNDGLNLSPVLKYNYADEVRGEIFIDQDDNCLVTTCSYSADFPVINAIQDSLAGGLDGVAFKMDPSLSNLQWSTYLGGSSDDASFSISLDNNQNILLGGGTQSQDFPISNALQATYNGGSADGFITKIHSSGLNLLHSTYYGTNDYDQIYFLDSNSDDEVYIFGQTKGPSGTLVQNASYNQPNGGQLLAKFNSDVSSIIWSTRFGDESGIPDISPTAFLVDLCNQVFLSGWGGPNLGGNTNLSGTAGLDITTDALDPTTDNADFYFMVMRDDASSLIYASFFGGELSAEHVDGGTSRFDKKGVIYQAVCAGCGGNQDFPTVPVDSIGFWNNNNSCNLGLVKYAFSPPSVIADFSLPPVDCVPQDLFFENLSQTAFDDTSASAFIWQVNDSIIESYDLNYLFTEAGQYTVSLLMIDSNSCNFADSVSQSFTIIGNSSQILDTLSTCANIPISIGVDPIAGTNVSYTWTPSTGLSNSNIANPTATIDQETSYTLIVSNGSCVDTFIQTLLIDSLNFSIAAPDSVCLGESFIATASGESNVFFQWEPATAVISGQGSSQVSFTATNPMTITVEATNSAGCQAVDSIVLFVSDELPDITAAANPDTIELGESSQLEAFSSAVNDFTWVYENSLSALNIPDPVATPLTTTTYTVEINDGLCPNKTDVTVYVKLPECIEDKIFVPNAFSPNGDGNNDVFLVRSSVPIDRFYVAVYDRWGQMVYESYDQSMGWDGSFKQKQLSPAAFAWYCSGFCEGGEAFFLKGNVSLIK